MKMLLAIVDDAHKEELETILHRVGASGYTEISQASGVGLTGPRLGSRAFPKSSAVIFSLLDEDVLSRLREEVRAYCQDCSERIKLVAWNADEILF